MAQLVTHVLPLVAGLQTDRASLPVVAIPAREGKLPDWVPARRVLGGFYLLRPLGGGNVGFPYSSFLLGLVNNGNIAVPTSTRLGKTQTGIYAQDKIGRAHV